MNTVMNMIVAVDNNWAIGNHNELLVSIPADMKFFRQETDGKVVVMGRKTLESFPNGRPLVNRVNIVLTENPDYQVKGAKIVHSLAELQEELKQYRSEDFLGNEMMWAVVPLAAARTLEQAGRARICHLTDPAPDRVSYLMTRRGEALSPAAHLLLEDIRTEIQRIEGVHMVQ